MGDNVSHPSHYNVGKIEVIDAIEEWGLNFSLGNAVKYIARADHKGKPVEDLKKARWYIEREIERRETCPEMTRFKFRDEECQLTRPDNAFILNAYHCNICDVCRFEYLEPDQYPCTVCYHGNGDKEYFELDTTKVEVIK